MIIGIAGKAGAGKDTVGKIIQAYLSLKKECVTMEDVESYSPHYSKWKIVKFAGLLKTIVAMLIGCTIKDLEDQEYKERELGEPWNRTLWHISDSVSNSLDVYMSKEEAEEDLSWWEENNSHHPISIREEEIRLTPRLLMQLLGTDCGRQIIHPDIWVNGLFNSYKLVVNSWDGEGNNKYPNWIVTDLRFPNEYARIKKHKGVVIKVVGGQQKELSHISETALDGVDFDFVIDNSGTKQQLLNRTISVLEKIGL